MMPHLSLDLDEIREIVRHHAARRAAQRENLRNGIFTGMERYYGLTPDQELTPRELQRRRAARRSFVLATHRLSDQLLEEERRARYARLVEDSEPLDSSSRHTWPQLGPIGGPVLRPR